MKKVDLYPTIDQFEEEMFGNILKASALMWCPTIPVILVKTFFVSFFHNHIFF